MNFKESKAIYLQIVSRICDEVILGQYREEERIPSVREYAAAVEANATTVMRSRMTTSAGERYHLHQGASAISWRPVRAG